MTESLDIIKTAGVVSLFSIGGWLIFESMISLFDLSALTPLWKIIIGFGVILLGTKLGWKRFMK